MKQGGYMFCGMAAISTILFAGCAVTSNIKTKGKQPVVPPVLTARHAEKPVVIDGRLDDEVWQKAPVYNLDFARNLYLAAEKKTGVGGPTEPGQAQLAWDDKFLYVGVKFTDSDIVQENEENQQHFYASGDVMEVFLKPEKSTWYWEIYGTPNAKKTVFWFPGRGRTGLKSCFEPDMNLDELLVAAQIKGTLNNWKDRDEYWTLEMAIPVKGLTMHGDAFGPGSEWRILVARYNYSRYLSQKELSMVPQLSVTNYHLLEEYGILKFEK